MPALHARGGAKAAEGCQVDGLRDVTVRRREEGVVQHSRWVPTMSRVFSEEATSDEEGFQVDRGGMGEGHGEFICILVRSWPLVSI